MKFSSRDTKELISVLSGRPRETSPHTFNFVRFITTSQHAPAFNPYARGISYSETPPAQLAHPVPHQPMGQFINTTTMRASSTVHEDGKIYALVIDLLNPQREGERLAGAQQEEGTV
ncbi:RNA-binding protein, CCR4-NOT complex subunit Rcd1 [Pleurotus ostreatus]|nr:RNA-binding protein, CCR4-NOT complex subunit Rcd1 [Pleurotus ostreatus]